MVMVGKLIKHELINTLRIAAIPALGMVLLAIASRIMLETSDLTLPIILIFFYVFSVIATIVIGYFFGVSSFYQSLFTGTGYLTLSLPVTADQLILSKLLSAITVMFASIIAAFLSALIFFIGLPQATLEQIFSTFDTIGNVFILLTEREPFLVAECVIYAIVNIPMWYLIFYAVMCVGQLFTIKNRKAMTLLLYVGLMFVWNIFSSTVVSPVMEKINDVSIHLGMWIAIIFCAGVDVGCYFFVRFVIKNKVNLLV